MVVEKKESLITKEEYNKMIKQLDIDKLFNNLISQYNKKKDDKKIVLKRKEK